jgi:Zn-dependent peptidase ImmA (M78 family)/transcriptional regulator with XRE-family HTH domain
MEASTVPSNLRRLRQSQGLTQAAMAEKAGLSRAGYRNIELARAAPRPATLEAIAEALGVHLRDLVTPVPVLRRVRFRSFRRLRTREGVLAHVAKWLGDFNDLEETLGDRSEYTLAGLARAHARARDGRRSPEAAPREVRERFGRAADEPVRDICGLLEANGIKVLSLRIASDAFFGLSVAAEDGGPAVVVNTWERISVERWIFSAAHELGHLVLHLADYEVGSHEESRDHEKEANLFAAHFLMPEDVFWREWQDTYGMAFIDRVLKVKRMFRVSYKTVLYRLAQSSAIETNVWQAFQSAYRARHGRSLMKEDEPEALAADAFRASYPEDSRAGEPEELSRADFMEDRLSRLVRRGVESSEISLARGAEILGLSLQQMRGLSAMWVG